MQMYYSLGYLNRNLLYCLEMRHAKGNALQPPEKVNKVVLRLKVISVLDQTESSN